MMEEDGRTRLTNLERRVRALETAVDAMRDMTRHIRTMVRMTYAAFALTCIGALAGIVASVVVLLNVVL